MCPYGKRVGSRCGWEAVRGMSGGSSWNACSMQSVSLWNACKARQAVHETQTAAAQSVKRMHSQAGSS
eukprot:3033019-Rhodomonas_salina.1